MIIMSKWIEKVYFTIMFFALNSTETFLNTYTVYTSLTHSIMQCHVNLHDFSVLFLSYSLPGKVWQLAKDDQGLSDKLGGLRLPLTLTWLN